jgi:hypothetical protein
LNRKTSLAQTRSQKEEKKYTESPKSLPVNSLSQNSLSQNSVKVRILGGLVWALYSRQKLRQPRIRESSGLLENI